ncbi:hypothetical protein KFE25_003752 [Diacronema lutheri]|uniref:Uncharacterized protein n=2 Tax=Diacronema lutheri TaxID=2081491 RepID=A0A8J6C7E9_DIALT|nr:hypothetical protein KFE25_003752 [Diacronema lutheri]
MVAGWARTLWARRSLRLAAAGAAAIGSAAGVARAAVTHANAPTVSLPRPVDTDGGARAPATSPARRGALRPFDDPELSAALAEREARQRHLLRFIAAIEPRVRAALAAGDESALLELRSELASKQETILFGGLPAERQRYLQSYGCAAWTDDALDLCARHSPLVEIGAGAGQWERALSRVRVPTDGGARGEAGRRDAAGGGAAVGHGRGTSPDSTRAAPVRCDAPMPHVDVIAFDDGSDVPIAVRAHAIGHVRRGGPEVLRTAEAAGRTLLLVYPPHGGMACACLERYKGDTLLYVGEARGGYNADDAFFDALEARWDVARVVPLRPYRGGFERLYELRRRRGWLGWATARLTGTL